MYSNFHKLKEEKKKQILSSAMEEFRQYGFEKASTIEIAKNAKISKGALFNYFNTKRDLYVYLIDYSLQVIEGFYEKIDLTEQDLFKRIENVGLLKLYTQQKYPYVFDFLTSTREEGSPEVKEIIIEKTEYIYKQGISKIYQNIDYSKFREDIDIEKAVEVINWTMLGFSEKSIRQLGGFENIHKFGETFLQEWKAYGEMLKKCYYK
ncbi:TetR/AcrR family transcriptional regulator [Isachenkonia alkalipeptolytica]|uniref:TetR/AcrR family transcriptional regulator n=1 Tax=Isachenkonia alkalipeptolytica TaxID=2565777 RepID=A0AA43XM83_9CLOT|nr:TetR/AcrR family transcriptional regulator [Isachenkonia alkalipeptolytica]NBG88824.1 TetR/AcrR family transcriptional regulator [Isachenkonia alkalipeptolytica]